MKREAVSKTRLLGALLCAVLAIGLLPAFAFAWETPSSSTDATEKQDGQNAQLATLAGGTANAEADNDCITISSVTRLQLGTMTLQPTWDGTMEYSTDKITWTEWNGEVIDSAEGTDGKHYLYVRGDNNTVVSGGTTWALMKPDTDATIDVSGNIETLRGATGDQPATLAMAANCYGGMFKGDQWLSSAPTLPATSLAENCYMQMFQECISLLQTPELPATTLAQGCYGCMFRGCNGLTAAPELPATNLADSCYANMFDACYYLKSAPAKLPANDLKPNCYDSMFFDCIRLENMPELPATNLAESCYEGMFANCNKLQSAPEELPAIVLADYCYLGMFTNCYELKKAPTLPAETLVNYCYSEMFLGCFSLTAPADMSQVTTLAYSCCYRMYENCINLALYNEAQPGYTKEWKATSATATADAWNTDMFTGTYGDFTGAPVVGATYYLADATPTTHTVVPADTEGGFVSINQMYYIPGKTVEARAVPSTGYMTISFVARDASGNETPIVNDAFTMPDSDVTVVATFKLDIQQCSISGIDESYTYTGFAIEPAVIVKNGDTILAPGTDYVVSYINNIDVGNATAVIMGKGDYAGTVSRTFTISKAESSASAKTSDDAPFAVIACIAFAACGITLLARQRMHR